MARRKIKDSPTSKEEWEKEVPPLTENQMVNQQEILNGLGKSKLQKSRWLYHTPDAHIEDYRIILPEEKDGDS
jgi:hypothetical protein